MSHFDRLCRRIFDRPEAGADLARNVLPQHYQDQIDFSSAKIEKGNYIDRDLRQHTSDLLFRFKRKDSGDELFLYVLVDHKSAPDKWTPLQMLRYVVKIYQHVLRGRPRPEILPEIVPVALYHGTRQWNYPLELAELISALSAQYVPKFAPLLYDLEQIEDSSLVGAVQTVVGLVSLKYIKRQFSETAVRYLLRELHRLPRGSSLLHEIYTALLEFKEAEELQLFLRLAREMWYRDTEEDMMGYGQKLREEGRVAGREEALQSALKRQFDKKFGLSPEEADTISAVRSIPALEAALDEMITANEKQQVLKKLGI